MSNSLGEASMQDMYHSSAAADIDEDKVEKQLINQGIVWYVIYTLIPFV